MCRRPLLKGRSGGRHRKLRVPGGVGQPGPADGPRHRRHPLVPCPQPGHTAVAPRGRVPMPCFDTGHRAVLSCPHPQLRGRAEAAVPPGCPFTAVPAWSSGLGERRLNAGGEPSCGQSSCRLVAFLACCLGCRFWRPCVPIRGPLPGEAQRQEA